MRKPSGAAGETGGSTRAGEVLDARYELVRRLDVGGTGEVREGIDRRIRRKVAIKLIREEADPALVPELVSRLGREATTAGRLAHPGGPAGGRRGGGGPAAHPEPAAGAGSAGAGDPLTVEFGFDLACACARGGPPVGGAGAARGADAGAVRAPGVGRGAGATGPLPAGADRAGRRSGGGPRAVGGAGTGSGGAARERGPADGGGLVPPRAGAVRAGPVGGCAAAAGRGAGAADRAVRGRRPVHPAGRYAQVAGLAALHGGPGGGSCCPR